MEKGEVRAIKYIKEDNELYVAFMDTDGNLFKMKNKKAIKNYFETVKNLYESLILPGTSIISDSNN